MKRVLIPFPTQWDQRQLPACRSAWCDRYEVFYGEPLDEDCPWNLDVGAWVEQAAHDHRGKIDGAFSSSDYPGAAAAAMLAERLGLAGTPPMRILAAAHKYYARLAQHAAVPEAVPRFCLVDPQSPEPAIGFPCFVKPVKAAFSLFARRMEDQASLTALLRSPEVTAFFDRYVHIFDHLLESADGLELDARRFIAESPLSGFQVTVEGFRTDAETTILGVVDSVMYPDTRSFARFDYPSFLGPSVQQRMADIASRAAAALGLEWTLFNVEMFYDPASDQIWIIELNPRLCGQFADLYQKVDGVNSYQVALSLAVGETPEVNRASGRYACASSYPLRVFRPSRFESVPDAARIAAAEAAAPGAMVWLEVEQGAEVSDFESGEDGFSARYAIINLGGRDRTELAARYDAVIEALAFSITDVQR